MEFVFLFGWLELFIINLALISSVYFVYLIARATVLQETSRPFLLLFSMALFILSLTHGFKIFEVVIGTRPEDDTSRGASMRMYVASLLHEFALCLHTCSLFAFSVERYLIAKLSIIPNTNHRTISIVVGFVLSILSMVYGQLVQFEILKKKECEPDDDDANFLHINFLTKYKFELMLFSQNAWFNFKNHMLVYTCAVYALLITLISIIIELGPTFQSADYWLEYSVFGVCMLSGAIAFFIWTGITNYFNVPFFTDTTVLSEGVGASTFFLKLGATVFGIFAIILWSIELFLAFASNVRPFICIFRTSLYILLHVLQLLFVVKSTRMVFRMSRLVLYFGFAHLLAVNLWTWMSLCVAKSGIHDDNEEHHIHFGAVRYIPWVLHPTEAPVVKNTTFPAEDYKLRTVTYYGESAITLITFNVQFCLISAGVVLSLFISTSSKTQSEETELTSPSGRPGQDLISTRSVPYVGFDNENTFIGVSSSIVMLVVTCLAVAFSGILKSSNYSRAAGITIGTFEIFFYSISIVSCFILYDSIHKNVSGNDSNREAGLNRGVPHQKIINIILLFIGASGEIILCFVGLLGCMNGSNGLDSFGLAVAVFLVRIIEVFLQSTLLLYLIRKGSQTEPCTTIGKQSITLLIGLNIILFGFHTAESTVQSFGFPESIDQTHLLFLRIALPLVVFYRFHCSLCFAEVWKAFYDYNTIMAWSLRASVQQLDIPQSINDLNTNDLYEEVVV